MGNSKYLDSLNSEAKKSLSKNLWEIQNHKCFICEKEIHLDINSTNIDHICPLANGGKDEKTNFAITHEHCNKSKQDADLNVAKKLFQLQEIIKDAESKKEVPSLKHVLTTNGGSKYAFRYKIESNQLVYSFDDIGDTSIKRTEIFLDLLSNEKTAFISVPVEYLYHDETINPRGINKSINLLIKEFHKPNPQLHISLARIDDGKIKIFDGQHKAVAQIMLGVRNIAVRLFIDPDIDRLIETNTIAGSKLKQIAFDKAIVRQLHDTLYAERLKKYQEDHSMAEDDFSFSEQELVEHFKGERGNVKVYIINSQKNAITHDPDNKLQSYINFEGRGTTLPLSYSTFEKTLLSSFVNAKTILNKPINYKMDEGQNPRILEKEQLVQLCNNIAEIMLISKFNDEIGTNKIENKIATGNGNSIADDHLIACRLFKEEIMYNWVQYIKLLVRNHFVVMGLMYDDENLFQQKFSDQLWDSIQTFLSNLRNLPVWKDRSMSATIFGGKNNYEFWKVVFSTGKTPDGTPVLATPLNVTDMIIKTN